MLQIVGKISVATTLVFFGLAAPTMAQSYNNLALTPPMGWI